MYHRFVIFRSRRSSRSRPEENEVNDPLQDCIHSEEEHRRNRRQYQHHDGGDDGFPAGRPGYLAGFLSHLLEELRTDWFSPLFLFSRCRQTENQS
jgi:hypothetical protein